MTFPYDLLATIEVSDDHVPDERFATLIAALPLSFFRRPEPFDVADLPDAEAIRAVGRRLFGC